MSYVGSGRGGDAVKDRSPADGKRRFVEDIGLVFADWGLPPMAGRVYGWLLVCRPPEQTAAELARAVGASRGSISTTTRLLLQNGLVERTRLPGRRSACYRIRPDSWRALAESKLAGISAMRRMMEKGLELTSGEGREARGRLEEMLDLYSFFEEEWPAIMERYARRRKRGRS
jgi:DNA-binding transcriptional regulator GbsR (MarR family)